MQKLILTIVLLLGSPVWANDNVRRITVVGYGSVETVPDMATITMGVVSEAKTGSGAMAMNSKAVAKVLQELVSAGIADKDMQTNNLSLSPRWENRKSSHSAPPRIVGFVARNTISVKVRDLDNLGVVLDAVVRNGANTFNGLGFGLQEPQPAQDQARQNAVVDAMRKAQLYAAAAGVNLGDVQIISESRPSVGGPVMMAMDEGFARSAAVPVAQGEVKVAASITVVFAIAE